MNVRCYHVMKLTCVENQHFYLKSNMKLVCDIVREYRARGLLVEVDTGKGTEESWEKLYNRLEKDIK
jgi:hypothetical protein